MSQWSLTYYNTPKSKHMWQIYTQHLKREKWKSFLFEKPLCAQAQLVGEVKLSECVFIGLLVYAWYCYFYLQWQINNLVPSLWKLHRHHGKQSCGHRKPPFTLRKSHSSIELKCVFILVPDNTLNMKLHRKIQSSSHWNKTEPDSLFIKTSSYLQVWIGQLPVSPKWTRITVPKTTWM